MNTANLLKSTQLPKKVFIFCIIIPVFFLDIQVQLVFTEPVTSILSNFTYIISSAAKYARNLLSSTKSDNKEIKNKFI